MEKAARVSKGELEEKEREALFLIKADLCKWLTEILETAVQPDTFLSQLDSGVLLCQVATLIQQAAKSNENTPPSKPKAPQIPLRQIQCNKTAKKKSFHARDNAANFISWCKEAGVEEAVMFESNGLVQQEDERRVTLCLLEVARIAGRVGMATPTLIKLEQEIEMIEEAECASHEALDKESEEELKEKDGQPPKQKKIRRRDSLDNKVLVLLNQCTCKNKLHVVSHGSGKFEITTPAGRRMIIYIRVLSDRILVRVGGGWDSIEHFILKHDPCRQGVSVLDSSLEKEVKLLAPTVKVVPSSSRTITPIPQRKAKQISPFATPDQSRKNSGSVRITKSSSTPLLSSTRKRKVK